MSTLTDDDRKFLADARIRPDEDIVQQSEREVQPLAPVWVRVPIRRAD